ncbi:MAG: FHIPEP family type III secretion protein [Treponema sp.]|uniref:flagellar biosynthesis protein FlhA n=1 Tax=Treponema sp. TaxID=166 RepID=UPI001D64ABC5|nr:flagellar biosynthesis protein FlhA [Treponema sp.]MBS7310957.1 FHIPEP family type III secretion protein [Treponema sp.]MCI5696887.1 flagellar biosynthesis protein FlhA [Spirochaetia bacterium]MDD5811611.1 flagellar biosynthesis protein FlhA [Treponema sp.]MDY5885507.1 flagellar biosynthesis protein FlhA [Treponema sp.]
MANERRQKIIEIITNNFVAVAAIFVVLMLIIPWPGRAIDIFMALNLALSISILLIVMYTPKSSNFTSFPRVILLVTLFGLGINVASTKNILWFGKDPKYMSLMVNAFSSFVIGKDDSILGLVVGMVVFIILIVIQVLVITKGATRVSEVAARFALDSMAQKNFAVDAELNTGAITEEQAQQKRAEIRRESDFYSAMDGSSKFVSGNVTAGIFITVVNLVAGLIIGVLVRKEQFGAAAANYCRMTIGDGLISQIPSLLLSFATGLIVTGSNSDEVLSKQLQHDFTVSGRVYIIGGAVLAIIGILPGMPHIILLGLGGLAIYAGIMMTRAEKASFAKKLEEEQNAQGKDKKGKSPGEVSPVVPLDPLSLELGYVLISLVDEEKGAELLERITRIRKEAAIDLGLVVPPIRITDNMAMEPSEYSFKIKGIEVGRSKLKLGYYMCMDTGSVVEKIDGEATRDPAFNMPAIWVPEEKRVEAENAGYAVVDPPTIIATHITEIIRAHAAEILGMKEVAEIIKAFREKNADVVEAVMDDAKFTYGQIQKILQNLLREQISIRNIELILETLANFGPQVNPWTLTEKVRKALGLQICLQYADSDKTLRAMTLSQEWTEKIVEHQNIPADGSMPMVALDPPDARRWIEAVSNAFASMQQSNYQPIIICPAEIRVLVKSSTQNQMPGLVVISFDEIMACGSSVSLEVLGEISY